MVLINCIEVTVRANAVSGDDLVSLCWAISTPDTFPSVDPRTPPADAVALDVDWWFSFIYQIPAINAMVSSGFLWYGLCCALRPTSESICGLPFQKYHYTTWICVCSSRCFNVQYSRPCWILTKLDESLTSRSALSLAICMRININEIIIKI